MGLNGMLRTLNTNITGGWSRQAYATTTSTGSVTNANNVVQTLADFKLKESRFGGIVNFVYDISKSILVNQRYVGFYNAQCCGVSFEYQAYDYPNQPNQFLLPHDRRFNMSFTLAGVGSFSNFFGAFGGSTF
jgi:hypothetical protein